MGSAGTIWNTTSEFIDLTEFQLLKVGSWNIDGVLGLN